MHRFIVYQYGKVGSTSLVSALNQLPDSEAFQSHFLGQAAFAETLQRLQDPEMPDYFFEHSCGQLFENLRIFRHFQRRGRGGDRLTILSVAREPFDWFRSCIAQDISAHLQSLRTQLLAQNLPARDDREVATQGLTLVFERLLRALDHLGSVDALCTPQRFQLSEVVGAADATDFRAFLYFLHMFIRPHNWFETHFRELLDVQTSQLRTISQGLRRLESSWGNIYLLHYESLNNAYQTMLSDLGYHHDGALPDENQMHSTPVTEAIREIFQSPQALKLQDLCQSRATRNLGYGRP